MKVIFLLFFALTAYCGFGQAATLDSTFGMAGKIIVDVGALNPLGLNTVVLELALQPDGKLIAVGYTYGELGDDFLLLRYLPNGSPDSSFGVDGRVISNFGGVVQDARSVALQPDGKIVVAGLFASTFSSTNANMVVARYHPNGSLDSTFNQDGVAMTNFGPGFTVSENITIQDGKIIIGGWVGVGNHFDFAAARYLANGSPDSTFNADGKVTTTFGATENSFGAAMLVQPDGKIILAGSAGANATDYFALVRYKTDGYPDSTFGVNGKVRTDFGEDFEYISVLSLLTDGKILAAGSAGMVYDNLGLLLARYNADGSLDQAFGQNGSVFINIVDPDLHLNAAIIQPDGKLVAVGSSGNPAAFTLARYHPDGSPDETFGPDGISSIDFGSAGRADSYIQQPDGKIVVAGGLNLFPEVNMMGLGYRAGLARYLTDLNLGVLVDFSIMPQNLLIYPNPLQSDATLQYELAQDEAITIQLTDLQGKLLHTLISQEKRGAGKQQEPVRLPETLPAGHYVLSIGTARGTVSVQVVK